MKNRSAFSFALLTAALAGCAPQTFYYGPGASVAAVDRALASCTAQAARDVPVVTETRYTPLRVIRYNSCDGEGNCTPEIDTEGGEPFEVDVNADRRAAQVQQCMARQGLAPVSLPVCSPAVARAAPAGVTTTLPRLTPQSCVVPRDGGLRIVTAG